MKVCISVHTFVQTFLFLSVRICSLLKFGKEKNIIDSFENEYLFFSPWRNFRADHDDRFGQFDAREANSKITQGKHLTIKIEGKEFRLHEIFKDFSCQMQEYPSVIPGNLCSLFAAEMSVGDTEKKFAFDDRLFTQGPAALLIYNVPGFFDSIDRSLEQLDYGYTRGKVIYYDPMTMNEICPRCTKTENSISRTNIESISKRLAKNRSKYRCQTSNNSQRFCRWLNYKHLLLG